MQAKDASFFISSLGLHPHPEGGHYREIYRSSESIPASALPPRFTGGRSFYTSIYYLLQEKEFSAFHRIKSDECWYWHAGGPLLIHVIQANGSYTCVRLGCNISAGEAFQFVVPAMSWFACELPELTPFALVSCMVAPGFDFADFEMAEEAVLKGEFPEYDKILSVLCK